MTQQANSSLNERTLLREVRFFEKLWGSEEWIVNNDAYCGKLLRVFAGWQCSLHHHKVKHETFYLLSGKIKLELGEDTMILNPGDAVEIPVGVYHRFGAIEDSVIIEFSTHHEDSDSYRAPGEESRCNPALCD